MPDNATGVAVGSWRQWYPKKTMTEATGGGCAGGATKGQQKPVSGWGHPVAAVITVPKRLAGIESVYRDRPTNDVKLKRKADGGGGGKSAVDSFCSGHRRRSS